LALQYLKDTDQSTPEIEMKAMQYVNVGYQRILTFECESGGFNWWEGDNPGNPILTALAIMMLKDTQKVYDAVDEAVITRARDYLERLQKGDGSWGEDRHLHAGNENLGAGTLRSTCYITWGLVEGGYGDRGSVKKALKYIEKGVKKEEDLYTLGLCANALAVAGRKGGALDSALKTIRKAGIEDGDTLHWEQTGHTLVYSAGKAAHVEISALMALAYIHSGRNQADVPAIVNYLAASKDPSGNWGYNTQASVLALKTFLAAATLEGGDTQADVSVLLNGEELEAQHFDNFNRDVVWQVEVPSSLLKNRNVLTLDYQGRGNLGYQVVSTHFVPWRKEEKPAEALTIDVKYDRRNVKVDETVQVKAVLKKNDPDAAGMVLVSLGLPPGFDVMTEDLELLKKQGAISLYEVTGRQLIVYLDDLVHGEPHVVEYRLKARYPVKAQTGDSEVRMYYQSDLKATQSGQLVHAD